MAAGMVRLGPCIALVVGLLMVATVAGEHAKIRRLKKRSVETPIDLYVQGSDVRVVKKSDQTDRDLTRVKRFKRQAVEADEEGPELQRTKRFKRDAPNTIRNIDTFASEGDELQRVKRNKRDSNAELHRFKREELLGNAANDEPALSRQKRFKRDLKVKGHRVGSNRIKRSGKKADRTATGESKELKRSKREDSNKVKAVQEMKKHTKKSQVRPLVKRHESLTKEFPIDIHQKGHLDDIVKKAMAKFKRSKHHSKRSKMSKGHRSKRAGHIGIKESSQMLKDISRDITRLQRLRRGIAHHVIKSGKAHATKTHH